MHPICTYRQRFDPVPIREPDEPLIKIEYGDLALEVQDLELAHDLDGGAGLRVNGCGGVESKAYELPPTLGTLRASTEID